jgi:KaiC/GvpD/RAD55 family RecA-like ATPase/DNA-binding NarL/FixJ family response regulator
MTGTMASSSAAQSSHHPRVAVEPRVSTPAGLRSTGIKPIDQRLGGVLCKRPFVISGNPGTGKSIACLEFLRQGLDQGETVLLITHDEPADVLASATFLGLDIDRPLREERLILLRFRSDFARQLCGAPSARGVFQELEKHVTHYAPARIAIDSIVPFLDGGAASADAIQSLIEFLDGTGSTSLLTFPGDMVGLYDGRLEPVMHRASAVFHLTTDKERNQRLESRKGRYGEETAPAVSFRIVAGAGMVVLDPVIAPVNAVDESRPNVLLVNLADALPNDLDGELRRQFQFESLTYKAAPLAGLAGEGVGAVLLNVRRDVFEQSLQLLRDLRRTNTTTPVVMVTPYVLRSADRTRALRAGADDFISTIMAGGDAVARIRAISRRGHRQDLMSPYPEPGMVLQPTSDGSHYQPMSGEALTKSIRGYLDRQVQPFFTLFVISPEKGDIGGFAKLALKIVRVESGDLVSVHGKKVVAYLDSARPKDLNSLRNRLRDHALRLGFGDIEIEALGFPANEDAVRALLGAPAAVPEKALSMKKPQRRGLSIKGAGWT